MSSSPVCPRCRSARTVQRVAAIVSSGVRQVRLVSADLLPSAGVSQSNLAALLAPPRRPGGGWLPLVLIVAALLGSLPVSCLVTVVVVQLGGASAQEAAASGAAERAFAIIAGLVAIAGLALSVGLLRRLERSHGAADRRWERQMARWRQTWYCHRCHAAFHPGSAGSVSPEQLGELLASGTNGHPYDARAI